MDPRTLTLPQPEVAAERLGFFRWGRVAGRILLTTDAADWTFLSDADFAELLAGRITEEHPRFEELQRKGFLRDGLDLDALAVRLAERSRHVRRGPHLHVVNLTAGGAKPAAMSRETAEKIAEFSLQSMSPSVTYELQGDDGEPLGNFEVLRRFVEAARSRSEQTAGKTLGFRVITNLKAMTPEIAEWLIANDVLVVTSFDGPAALHDAIRRWKGGSPHADVVRWIEHFHRRYGELGRDPGQWRMNALMTTTRQSLGAGREIVDEYVARGLRTIHLRPLDRSRVSAETWKAAGYGREEWLDFYRRTLDYIVDLNKRGVAIGERQATVFLMKILTADDPGFVDVQSPAGDGTSQIAYDVAGHIYPSDDARRLAAAGDPIFELGSVETLPLGEVAKHPTVRSISAASLLDAQPQCADCWNKPFCGFSPVRNFITQGDLFGQRPHCFACRDHLATSSHLFELLADGGDPAVVEVLKRWTVNRPPLAIDGRTLQEAP